MIYPSGFLPYGSDDESVLFAHDLTVAPTIATIPSAAIATVGTGSVTHDSVLGMLAGTASYRIADLTNGAPLDWAGQIRFQVQKEWICQQATGSDGDANPVGNQTAISFSPTAGPVQYFARWSAGGIGVGWGSTFATTNWLDRTLSGTPVLHTAGKGDFVDVCLSWSGGKVGGEIILGIDGTPIARGVRNNGTLSDMVQLMYLGSDRGAANTFLASRYMRRLQIATRPAMFATHPKLAKVVLWGDSLVNTNQSITGSTWYDCPLGHLLAKELARYGLFCGQIIHRQNSGYAIYDGDPSPLENTRATMLADNPTLVVMIAGTNDGTAVEGYAIDAAWNEDLEDHVNTITSHASVQAMVVATTPSFVGDSSLNTTANQARRAAIDVYKKALPDSYAECFIADAYAEMGGENPPDYCYQGQISGANDDLHPRPVGNHRLVRAIARTIVGSVLP